MRISTQSILRNYNAHMGKSMSNLDKARTRVATSRNFMKTSEDPGGSLKAYQLRRDFIKNEDHLENIKMAQGKFVVFDSNLNQINAVMQEVNAEDNLSAINGTMPEEARKTFAEKFDKVRETLLLQLNAKEGAKYVFGGTNTKYPPFTVANDESLLYYYQEDTDGTPLYFNVDTGELYKNGVGHTVPSTDPLDPPGTMVPATPLTLAEMQSVADEKLYLDTGFGLQIDGSGNVVEGTALNLAYPGTNIIGFGTDGTLPNGDPVPKNAISLLKMLSDELRKDDSNFDMSRVHPLRDAFSDAYDRVVDQWTSIGTMDSFLQATENRLVDNRINLNTKIIDIENVDEEMAIMEFEFAKYAYNAALKVGMSILQPSFIDFMK